MKPSIYIETTIFSFYHEIRTDPDMVARRQWTRDWWDNYRSNYELFTSDAVIDELERGDFPIKDDAGWPARRSGGCRRHKMPRHRRLMYVEHPNYSEN